MQNIVDKFISEKNEKGIILELYEKGLKQKEIEQFIIDKFNPLLKNKSILRVQMLAYLHQVFENHLHVSFFSSPVFGHKAFLSHFSFWIDMSLNLNIYSKIYLHKCLVLDF